MNFLPPLSVHTCTQEKKLREKKLKKISEFLYKIL